ncbi:pro-resilin-like isoform X1 [Schistocerca nitens]|uniref:pro-resilin-like n=1 Tax=Schistocerca nitens TaxID=7011 RepID=UPI002117FA83|nr:pro-resilin-like [Schistocerca nitens]XP_049816695.1 pro-resilin-like isoform X1 [Schistocerca nitens]
MKVLVLLSTLVLSVVAEAPIDRSYLPPSSEYGPPSASSLSTQYSAPSADGLSTQYGAPALTGAAFGRSGASSQGPAARVSSSFGSASSRTLGAGRRIGGGVSIRYGASSAAGRATGLGGLGLSTQYGAPSYSGDALSTQYGAPSGNAGGLSPVYGVPGYGYGRAGGQEDSLAEPANYEFSYSVQDGETLSDFGQEESRQGESAQGQYRVLLPDGRKQIVSYQADEGGYRPTVEYQDTGLTAYSAGGYGYGRGRAGAGAGTGNRGYHYRR